MTCCLNLPRVRCLVPCPPLARMCGAAAGLHAPAWTARFRFADVAACPRPLFLATFRLALSYVSNDTLSVAISLSNFGDGDLPASSKVVWSILLDGKAVKTAVVPVATPVPQGELGLVASIDFVLPDVGKSATFPMFPPFGADLDWLCVGVWASL